MPRRPITETSHGYKRATAFLKRPAGEWINEQRAEGLSWRNVANKLFLVTKGQMHVNESTLANWHKGWTAEQSEVDA